MFKSTFLPLLCFGAVLASSLPLVAEESFESLVGKLNDDNYAARMEAVDALTAMCRKQPALLDRLAPLVFDEGGDVEPMLLAREVAKEACYVARGAIGFALDQNLVVRQLVDDGPAAKSGIKIGHQLISFDGKPVAGKTPSQVYAMIHATRPGAEIDMEFLTGEKEKVVLHPVAAARSAIRSDENVAERKQQLYEEWLERKREELQPEAD